MGVMTVYGAGWASRPGGRETARRTAGQAIRFAERRERDGHVVAIWNGRHGAAWFRSDGHFTPAQVAAIDRVQLFEEGDMPTGCGLRTIFDWGLDTQ